MNFSFFVRQITLMLFMTVGASMEMIGGTLDLSFAAQLSASTIVGVWLIKAGWHPLASCFFIILFNVVLGCMKGICLVKFRIPSIVVTLAFQLILSNIFEGLTDNGTISAEELRPVYQRLQSKGIVILLALIFTFAAFLFLEHTYYGKYCRMLGENPTLAEAGGLNCLTVSVIIHIFASLYFAAPAILLMFQTGMGSSALGSTYLYPVLTAVFLGGFRPGTGRGRVRNMVFSAIAVALSITLLTWTGYLYRFETILEGSAILLSLVWGEITENPPTNSENPLIEKKKGME